MIVYSSTKKNFMLHTEADELVDRVSEGYKEHFGRPSPSEERSWTNSLGYMYRVLNDNDIPDSAGVAIEFNLPGTSKRVDFIISGKDDMSNNNLVIIELKQWESAETVDGAEGTVRTFIGGGIRPITHPSYQAWSYAAFFRDYSVSVQEKPIKLYPCAYLHNYTRQDPENLEAPQYLAYTEKAPPFMKGELDKLRDFIKRYVKYGDDQESIYEIKNSEIRPSKSLQDLLDSMLKGNEEFVLIDSQRIVYDAALIEAATAKRTKQKKVMIVEGGPGTGKSVVAINLLVKLTQLDMVAQYVTRNSAPRNVYEAKLSGSMKKGRISNLFKTSGSYMNTPLNSIDVIISDESHRLTDRSGLFRNQGEDQIKEIIHTAQFSIFFIDESQRVTTYDFGSVEKIERFAQEYDAEIIKMELESQFRCDGSDGYIAWLDDVLEIRKTAYDNAFQYDYDIRVFDDPGELRDTIFKLNEDRNKARLLAGYCWNWDTKKRNDTEHADIIIPGTDFEMSWNLNNTDTWAIDPESVKEVGCIHTSQGLEFDYVGVIIGPDLRYEDGKVITDLHERARTDQSLRGIKKMLREDPERALALADELIKNTYRTLMSRGMKGCYIYCCDEKLAEYFKLRLGLSSEFKIKGLDYKSIPEVKPFVVAEDDSSTEGTHSSNAFESEDNGESNEEQ